METERAYVIGSSHASGIDLRGRLMRHCPWGPPGPAAPVPESTVKEIMDAFLSRGGSVNELRELLDRHLPVGYSMGRCVLHHQFNRYSLEFYFYLFTFCKTLLDDPRFCYRPGTAEAMSGDHYILEQGPMKWPPWLIDRNVSSQGYLPVDVMRIMFEYAEESLTPADHGPRLAQEALAYLNLCTPPEYYVERSFFERNDVRVSLEYVAYLAALFQLLTNDSTFISDAAYTGYGAVTRDLPIARFRFRSNPIHAFLAWQSATWDAFDTVLERRGRTLNLTINMQRAVFSGWFGPYSANCIHGAQQVCLAFSRAITDAGSRKLSGANLFISDEVPHSFQIQIRWTDTRQLIKTAILAGVCGVATVELIFLIQIVAPSAWKAVVMYGTAGAVVTVLAALCAVDRGRWRAIDSQFREVKKGMDKQIDVLECSVHRRTGELEEAFLRLQSLDRSKTDFITNITHELRTTLTLLSVPLEGIRSGRYGDNLLRQHRIFSLLERNIRRLSRQIEPLLNVVGLDRPVEPFKQDIVDLVSFCRELVEELRSLAEQKRIDISFHNGSGRSSIPITANRNLLEIALINVVTNAIKFTHDGHVRVTLSATENDDAVVVAVEDTGIGFPTCEREVLLHRFTRSGNADGTGLGLARVHEIATQHNWKFDVVGEPGRGTSVFLTIPYYQTLNAGPHEPSCTHDNDSILIVEDDPDMQRVLRDMLEPYYTLYPFPVAPEALAFLKTGTHVSLIICDVLMPGMNGFEFHEKLNADGRWNDVPFIFLTAVHEPGERLTGLRGGALDYICKPFTSEELLLKIRNLQAMRRSLYRQAVLDSGLAERLVRISTTNPPLGDPARYGITAAEQRVLELLRRGMQDKEIARDLSLSTRTVSSHLRSAYQKTGTGNRVELLNKLFGPQT